MRLSLTDSFKCRSSFAQSISLGQISCGIIILTPTYQLNAIYSLFYGVSEFFDTTTLYKIDKEKTPPLWGGV